MAEEDRGRSERGPVRLRGKSRNTTREIGAVEEGEGRDPGVEMFDLGSQGPETSESQNPMVGL